jgi:hypothetical protein
MHASAAVALRCVMQRQQLQQQAPRVDVLVVAADVCNKAAMERAVREHVSRCTAALEPGPDAAKAACLLRAV